MVSHRFCYFSLEISAGVILTIVKENIWYAINKL